MAEITGYKKDILEIFKQNLPFEKLSNRNILIIGATGLIGGCLVEALMLNPAKNYNVFAAGRNKERAESRFKNYFQNQDFHFLQYDVLKPLETDINFDYIVHCASNASPNFFAEKPVEVMKANIYGTANLIEFGLRHNMKRFLYVSSGEIYGQGDGRIFSEDYCGYVNPTFPRSCYPSSKRAAETLCVSYAQEYGADIVIARPCHIYGPYFTESDNRVYSQFIRNVINGENIVMKSDGSQFRSYCYVVDCVSALLHILLKGDNCQAYNIADENSNVSIKELAEMIADICNKKVIIDAPSEKEKCSFNVVKKSIFSSKKINSLGWNPSLLSMKTKLISTIEEHKQYCNERN